MGSHCRAIFSKKNREEEAAGWSRAYSSLALRAWYSVARILAQFTFSEVNFALWYGQ